MKLTVDPHPLLEPVAFVTHFPRPLSEMPTPESWRGLMTLEAPAPLKSDDAVREAGRRLLRHGGFKPTGRSKPAAEYLLKAAAEARMPWINLAVDACNIVSLHSGLPISVIDRERAREPFRIGLAGADEKYVFNSAGQTIDIAGLLCLFDGEGPCANAVKDSQRTKTHPATITALSVLWGSRELPGRAAEAARWYRQLLEDAGARTEAV